MQKTIIVALILCVIEMLVIVIASPMAKSSVVLRFLPEDVRLAAKDHKDPPKHKQMIACMIKYGADNDGWITKVKLAKLVYLADFAYYYENGKSISGLTYVKYPRGPVAEAFFLAVDELEDGGTITREFSGEATRFSLVEKNVRRSKLSERELDTIRVVARAWRNRSTEETAEFTYSQLPYRMSGDGCKIVYDLISKERPEMVYGGIKSEHVMNVG